MLVNTDPSSEQHTIVVACIVTPIVTSLFVGIRVWTRTFASHWTGWDDCKLPRFPLLVASLSYILDAALVTWVSTSLWWPLLVAAPLMRFEKLFCIAYSILVGLGVLLVPPL